MTGRHFTTGFLLLLTGCFDATSPVLVRPELATLVAIDPFWSALHTAGFVAITGNIPAANAPLQENERIEVLLETSNGDVERPLLQRQFCAPGPYSCTLVSVTMHEGATISDIAPRIASSVARWWIVCQSQTCGALRVFNPAKVEELIFYLRTLPGIAIAQQDPVRSVGADPPPDKERPLISTLPLSNSPATPHDGILQAAAGDSIFVTYRQPDGAILKHSATLPDMSP